MIVIQISWRVYTTGTCFLQPFFILIIFVFIYYLHNSKTQKPSSGDRKKRVAADFVKFIGKHLCPGPFFNKTCNFIKKETSIQVFLCEFSQIFKNSFS